MLYQVEQDEVLTIYLKARRRSTQVSTPTLLPLAPSPFSLPLFFLSSSSSLSTLSDHRSPNLVTVSLCQGPGLARLKSCFSSPSFRFIPLLPFPPSTSFDPTFQSYFPTLLSLLTPTVSYVSYIGITIATLPLLLSWSRL